MNTDPLLAAEVGLVRAELETLLARRDSLRRDVEAVRQEREAGEEYLRLLAERTQQAKADLKTVEAEAASAGAAAESAHEAAARINLQVRDRAASALGLLEIAPGYMVRVADVTAIEWTATRQTVGLRTGLLHLPVDPSLFPDLASLLTAMDAVSITLSDC